ncbi:hypothetical protein AVEN_191419-1 [Araneus ventricosus]|uniref:Uncharacterized protein n=1 Tax=Araneus ventricosus TaxID=182803 RepID=A0A4Y2NK74_ARAVE|nr:hypothetical protein AVEN_191419-1 [Araneus ventricosus]
MTKLGLAPPLQTFAPAERRLPHEIRFNVNQADIHSGSSVESGFEPGISVSEAGNLPQGHRVTQRQAIPTFTDLIVCTGQDKVIDPSQSETINQRFQTRGPSNMTICNKIFNKNSVA